MTNAPHFNAVEVVMRFGLMRRSSQEWVQSVSALAQRASLDTAQTAVLYAEVRRVNDALLATRVKNNDPARRRKALDRMVSNLKYRQPGAAAFVAIAEAPRRYQDERQSLRTRLNAAAEAIQDQAPSEAVSHMQAARDVLVKIPPGVFSPEAHQDLPRALDCVTLMANGEGPRALQQTCAMLLDIGARGDKHPSLAQARVLRAMIAQLLQKWDPCDVAWEHTLADKALPALRALLLVEYLFALDFETRQKIAVATAADEADLSAYETLVGIAERLRIDGTETSLQAAAIVCFCADRRVRACYWKAQEEEIELNSLTPAPSLQWAFNDTCQKTLQTFYQAQKKEHEPAYLQTACTAPFNKLFFNANVCLRALAQRNMLAEFSALNIVALQHYLLEEIYMVEEA